MKRRSRVLIGSAVMLAAIAVYAAGALRSPVWNDKLYAEQQRLQAIRAAENRESAEERALAEAYWERYPDVARSPDYGVDGPLGIHGAREHYRRHGRFEGRKWGLE